jgi:hypothetical protein
MGGAISLAGGGTDEQGESGEAKCGAAWCGLSLRGTELCRPARRGLSKIICRGEEGTLVGGTAFFFFSFPAVAGGIEMLENFASGLF